MEDEIEWCPRQNGTYIAFEPEYFNKVTQEWEPVPTKRSTEGGVPSPYSHGGISTTICLFGYAQARALGWGWAAEREAKGEEQKIRIRRYEVKYEIKARKLAFDSQKRSE